MIRTYSPVFSSSSASALFKSTILTVFVGLLIGRVWAQPGTLDLSFGGTGIVTTDVGPGDDKGFTVIQQTDGKLVVGGLSNNGSDNDFALTRYNPNGSLDATFGISGLVITPMGPSNESGQCVIQQTDGKLLLAGFASNGSNNDFAIARYLIDGSLDTSFGTGGIVLTPIGSLTDQGQGIALQTNGKILVAGFTDNGTNTDFALVRYTPSGVLDNTFDSDGIVTTDVGLGNDVGRSVAVQTDGKIVVAGWSSNGTNLDFAVARYDTTGALDNSFDTDGKVITTIGPANDQGYSVAIQTDGKLVVAGVSDNGSNQDFSLVRYNTDGSLDNSFDTDGKVVTDFTGGNDLSYSVAIQNDGKILAGGQTINGANKDFGLARYTTNGALDITYDTDGLVTTDVGGNNDVGWAVTIQADGRTVVAGSNQVSTSFTIAVTRYDACEIVDTSVSQTGVSLMANGGGIGYQWVSCDSSYVPIAGATGSTFIATVNGSYAVIISATPECFDTSACFTINSVGIENEDPSNLVLVYPNPTQGLITIHTKYAMTQAMLRLINTLGETMLVKPNLNGNAFMLDISMLPAGVYYLEIQQGPEYGRIKLVKN